MTNPRIEQYPMVGTYTTNQVAMQAVVQSASERFALVKVPAHLALVVLEFTYR